MAISDVEVRHVDIDVEAAYADAEGMLESYPARGPAAVAYGLRPYIEGKVVCDLGCGGGDLVWLMGKWAERAIGVENGVRYGTAATPRGADNVSIEKLDYFQQPIPQADVYYFWPNDPVTIDALIERMLEVCAPTTLIAGSRLSWIDRERAGRSFRYSSGNVRWPNFLSLIATHGGHLTSFDYLEDSSLRVPEWPDKGVWCLSVIQLGQ
jgi:hypothetical protein|tara:strand:+ start:4117 stop:4743 length:627 start_codon:yes stop_codon:yes gene_type:complete